MANEMPDDSEFEPWSPEAASRLREAARQAARAILDHADAVLSVTDDSGTVQAWDRPILDANDQLREVLVTYSNAQFEYSGDLGPLWQLEQDYPEIGVDDAPETQQPPASMLAILERRDFELRDHDAVIAAGRAAYLRVWPDDTSEAAAKDVADIGRALYQVWHASGGWDAIAQIEGVRETATTSVLVPVESTLGSDPDSWPDNPFELDLAQAVYKVSNVYRD